MTRLEERIRTGLHETAERIPETAPTRAAERVRSTRPAGGWVAVAAVLGVLILFTPILFLRGSGPDTTPADDPSPFPGKWVSIDGDLSTPTMEIEVSTEGVVEMVVVDEDLDDDFASVCSGASSTMTGIGQIEEDDVMVFPSPELTCDDGSQPRTLDGSPIEDRLQNLTFTYRSDSDTLIDNFGERWTREGVQSTRLGRWPQASLEEVEDAQELAEAGDPNFTWQLEPNMESMDPGEVPELLARAVQKRFGWEESVLVGLSGTTESEGIQALGFQLVRCAPGKSNPLRPDDPLFGDCAPTIDDYSYETVEIFVTQPGKQGPDGIWVVSSWPSEVSTLSQVAAMTEAEVAAVMDGFLQARVAGEGAEQYLGTPDDLQHFEIGYLYATSTGAPYERAEFEVEGGEIEDQGPQGGAIGLIVRLFAEGGQTVVEQTLELEWHAGLGRWVIYQHEGDQTTENGVPLPRL